MRGHFYDVLDSEHYAETLLKICDGCLGSDAEGVQLCFRRFFSKIRGFIVKKADYTFLIQISVHHWPLLSPIFRAAYESRVEKTGHILKHSTNRSNLLILHKTGSAGQPGCLSLIETGDNPREQVLENTAGEVGLPISTFPRERNTEFHYAFKEGKDAQGNLTASCKRDWFLLYKETELGRKIVPVRPPKF
ncbi:uncharacterized protein TNCV_3470451 [Trichonephila clavipes]|nr:uncharacterized protein TNCV_3470451 [Trichonephila clavipes]